MATVKRGDIVTTEMHPSTMGLVIRVARDGSWADVDWGRWSKRMRNALSPRKCRFRVCRAVATPARSSKPMEWTYPRRRTSPCRTTAMTRTTWIVTYRTDQAEATAVAVDAP